MDDENDDDYVVDNYGNDDGGDDDDDDDDYVVDNYGNDDDGVVVI